MFALIDHYIVPGLFVSFVLLMTIGLYPIRLDKVEHFSEIMMVHLRKLILFFLVFGSSISSLILYYLFRGTEFNLIGYYSYKLNQNWLLFLFCLFSAFVLKILYYRYITVLISDVKKRWVNQVKTEKLSSITDTIGKYEAEFYELKKYINLNKGIFVGLDAVTRKPVYEDIETFKKTGKEIMGAAGSGKGVIACIIVYQKILLGWGEIYIDPKPDRFVPRVMELACREAGKTLRIVDFVDGKPGQYAPFRGGTIRDISARLKQALKVRRTGGAEDFYKGQEINLIDKALKHTNRGLIDIRDYLKKHRLDPAVATGVEDTINSLCQIPQAICKNGSVPHPALDKKLLYPAQDNHRHTGGISISRAIMESQVIYVRGDTVDTEVRTLTKLFLTEATQEVKRLRDHRSEHFSIDVDECKFMMSEILSDTLATIRDFDCDMTLQYQALEDIETSIEKDIDMKALAQAVHVNCQIKIIHGGQSPRTAEYVSEQSGTINKRITAMDKVTVQKMGAEKWEGDKMIRDQQEELFTTNDFLSMKPFVYAYLSRGKLTRILTSTPVNVEFIPIYPELLLVRQ